MSNLGTSCWLSNLNCFYAAGNEPALFRVYCILHEVYRRYEISGSDSRLKFEVLSNSAISNEITGLIKRGSLMNFANEPPEHKNVKMSVIKQNNFIGPVLSKKSLI
jgi:hypothetical protein